MNKFKSIFNPKYITIALVVGLVIYGMSLIKFNDKGGITGNGVTGTSDQQAIIIVGCMGAALAEKRYPYNNDSQLLGEIINSYYILYIRKNGLTINTKGKGDILSIASRLSSPDERTIVLEQCSRIIVQDQDLSMIKEAVETAANKIRHKTLL